MSNRVGGRAPQGFTLMEFLIVIAIIAILAAFLLPVLTRSKGTSRRAVCTSNLRQLHQAFQMYTADNAGLVPPYPNRIGATWGENEGGPEHPLPERGAALVASLRPYTGSAEVWFCPIDPHARTDASVGGIRHKFSSYVTGFSLNYPMPGTPVTMEGRAPHLQVLLSDNLWGCDYNSGPGPRPAGDPNWPYSHQERYLYLFFDGHVKALSKNAPECIHP